MRRTVTARGRREESSDRAPRRNPVTRPIRRHVPIPFELRSFRSDGYRRVDRGRMLRSRSAGRYSPDAGGCPIESNASRRLYRIIPGLWNGQNLVHRNGDNRDITAAIGTTRMLDDRQIRWTARAERCSVIAALEEAVKADGQSWNVVLPSTRRLAVSGRRRDDVAKDTNAYRVHISSRHTPGRERQTVWVQVEPTRSAVCSARGGRRSTTTDGRCRRQIRRQRHIDSALYQRPSIQLSRSTTYAAVSRRCRVGLYQSSSSPSPPPRRYRIRWRRERRRATE